jgi:uncharacterized RDD family membrane protein YckC
MAQTAGLRAGEFRAECNLHLQTVMNWYYVEAGQQAGPVDDAQLQELVRSGKVLPETLVWQQGMANWQPYGEVKPQGLRLANPVTTTAGTAPGEAVCSECGGVFNVQDMIQHGNLRVCAQCKPILLQKLAEGAKLKSGSLVYAGFWIRFAAVLIDGLLLWAVNAGITVAAGFSMFQSFGARPVGLSTGRIALFLVEMLIGLAYEVVLIGAYGATLGKMACRIKVVVEDGSKVSYLRSLGRHFAKALSGFICFIGYLMAAFDEEKRALHDRICSTRVVLR